VGDETLSHVDDSGRLQMVDVSHKPTTIRTARAGCIVATSIALDELGTTPSGLDAIQSARLSGIQAAKDTSRLIPLCHPLELTDVKVDVAAGANGLMVESSVTTIGRTGVEMEALTACAVCAVSLLDSIHAVGGEATVTSLQVLSKTGGKSDWGRDVDAET
jgi:cyclic pyranopterin phosphate synthase